MATLDQLDQALATAMTNRATVRTALTAARQAWHSATNQLGLSQMPNVPGRTPRHAPPAPPAPSTPVTTAQLQGLADAFISAKAAFATADAAVTAAQTAFDAASKAARAPQ